jgi:hypothetical protein
VGLLVAATLLAVSAAGCTTKEHTGAADDTTITSSPREPRGGGGTTLPSPDSSDESSTAEQCQAVLVLMGGLSVGGALPEGQVRDDLEQKLAEARTKVPEQLQGDVEVIAEGVQGADGIVEWGRFIASPEYRDAVGNLQRYLTDNCGASDLLPE